MKRIITLAAMLFAAMLILSGCEEHAFTVSDNYFRYSNGKSDKALYQDLSIKANTTVYIYAVTKDGENFTEGSYEASISTGSEEDHYDPNCVSVNNSGMLGDIPCLAISGVSKGKTSVTVNFRINNFHLYKSVEITVK